MARVLASASAKGTSDDLVKRIQAVVCRTNDCGRVARVELGARPLRPSWLREVPAGEQAMKRALLASATVLALTGTAHAESWAMRCRNSVDGSAYSASWHGDTGFVIIAADGKSPHQYFASGGNGRTGWSGMKALGVVHFDNGAQLEAYFELPNLSSTFTEGGSHMLYRGPMGDVITQDVCAVTNHW
jgi:hypothetical protein